MGKVHGDRREGKGGGEKNAIFDRSSKQSRGGRTTETVIAL